MKPDLLPVTAIMTRRTAHKGMPSPQAGAFLIEFALILLVFLTIVFIAIEMSRALYIVNTLQEVTRRAARQAAVTNFSDATAMAEVRRNAIFRTTDGELAFASPVSERHILVDYLARHTDARGMTTYVPIATLPACPARNRVICAANDEDASCIRFVRARVCDVGSTASNCIPIPYQAAMPLLSFPMKLPVSSTIAKAETLGYTGTVPCS